jgi:uncharacterized protein YndB with AHSA1/START domain
MSERSVEHATFVVERSYDAAPDRVFAAWSDPHAKTRWFGGSDERFELDFRVGGRERRQGIDAEGNAYTFQALYQDIVPASRIVYTYDMLVGATRISVSMATVEFRPQGAGTRLVFTEQGVFLDGQNTPARREHGMGSLLDALGAELRSGRAGT